MNFERLDDPTSVNPEQIAAILAANDVPTVQFSKPLKDKRLLSEVNALCERFGDRLEVRFYGHYGESFDASVLSQLPRVQNLSINCLTRASAIEHLFTLTELRKFALGIFELDAPDILGGMHLGQLRELSLIETRKNNIDLAPLARCQDLEKLFVGSHRKGIDVLQELQCLRNLTLGSISRKQSLAFVSKIQGLRKLRVILGGRNDINEIVHPGIDELEVVRVLGLTSMGDLERFPGLEKIRIEDQIRLEAIDFGRASRRLKDLRLINCKKLTQIGSLSALHMLEEINIAMTAIDFDSFVSSGLPQSLRTVGFWTGKQKPNDLIRSRLDALGYRESKGR